MERKVKLKEAGITLVALVVTIIVLLILAGITIALALSNNGILQRAKDASETWANASENEEAMMGELYNDIYTHTEGYAGLQGGENSGGSPGESGYAGSYYDDPYIPINFEHKAGTTTDWNAGYTIIGKTGTDNAWDEFVWVPCVLDQSTVKSGDTVQTFTKNTTGKYNSNNFTLHPSGGTNDEVEIEDSSVSEIRTSVGIHGGFYIAKYEAGISGTQSNWDKGGGTYPLNENVTPTDGSVKPLSQGGVGVWNGISRDDSITVSKAMISSNTGAKSTLISGECWDTTLAWITATADSSYAENSAGKGWYKENREEDTTHTTGYYGTNTNNIFDMGGNAFECTTENCSGYGPYDQVIRGGSYSSSNVISAAYRTAYDGPVDFISFRVVLYK